LVTQRQKYKYVCNVIHINMAIEHVKKKVTVKYLYAVHMSCIVKKKHTCFQPARSILDKILNVHATIKH
jgi:hypothetical protein